MQAMYVKAVSGTEETLDTSKYPIALGMLICLAPCGQVAHNSGTAVLLPLPCEPVSSLAGPVLRELLVLCYCTFRYLPLRLADGKFVD